MLSPKLYSRILDISKAMKPKCQNGAKFHIGFIIKASKIVTIGWNDYAKSHNSKKFGEYKQNHKFARDEYEPCIHAETDVISKFAGDLSDLRRHKMVVVRIDNNGKPAMSKPCANCQRVLGVFAPKEVFYSNEAGECEELILN